MLLRLGEVLDLPLRDRNLILHAAGFAPAYEENDLDHPTLQGAVRVLDLMLEHHEPYPAVVVDRCWNLKRFNRAALRWVQLFVSPDFLSDPHHHNAVRLVFDPGGMRPFITNWEEVAATLMQRLHRDLLSDHSDSYRELVEETLATEGVPPEWRVPDWTEAPEPLIPIALEKDEWNLHLVSTISTLGTPLDVTLQELRIESFFPADESTQQQLRALAEMG